MPMDLVFVLKWVKSDTGCLLYTFHLSGKNVWKKDLTLRRFCSGRSSGQGLFRPTASIRSTTKILFNSERLNVSLDNYQLLSF